MTTQDVIDSGATGAYAATTFTQGMASFPGYVVAFHAGVVTTGLWAKPNSERMVEGFIRQHDGEPRRVADRAFG